MEEKWTWTERCVHRVSFPIRVLSCYCLCYGFIYILLRFIILDFSCTLSTIFSFYYLLYAISQNFWEQSFVALVESKYIYTFHREKMEIYLTYLSAFFKFSFSVNSNVCFCVIFFQARTQLHDHIVTMLLWYHDHFDKELRNFLFINLYTVLLDFNLFHLVFSPSILNTHSFVTFECYLTNFCLFVCFIWSFVWKFIYLLSYSLLFHTHTFYHYTTTSVAVNCNNFVCYLKFKSC